MRRTRLTFALSVVLALLVVTGCGSSVATAPALSAAPSTGVASTAPVHSQAPDESVSTSPEVIGSGPRTVSLSVGDHGAGFVDVLCQDLRDGELSITSGDPIEGDWFTLVFRPDRTVSSLSGALRGVGWEVTQNAQGTLNADMSGTFSGTDAISGADVSGTFACE